MTNQISKIKLNKKFGRHWPRILTELKHEKGLWYSYNGLLPSLEEYKARMKRAFTTTVASAVEDAMGEIGSLRDEMQEWYDNMPESFQSADKGQEVEEAASALDSACGNFNDNIPDKLQELDVYIEPQEGGSRSARAAGAVYALRQVIDVLQEKEEEIQKTNPEDELLEELDSLKEELEGVCDEVDGVSFPGMY